MSSLTKKLALPIVLTAWISHPASAALSWPNCKDIADTDFKVTTLVSRAGNQIEEPMKMAFDLLAAPGEDAKGKVDIYFTERKGNLRKYDSKQNKVLTLGTFTFPFSAQMASNSSDGLLGIALDPAFKTNHFIYLYYSYSGAGEASWRISRFTLNATNDQLDMATEKVVLKVPTKIGAQHPGGALQFDAYGDLWITTGNDYLPGANEFPVWSSANTNDLRGKILRIHPTPDGGYTIPDGNLFAKGTAKTLPEIYVMGTRNPYTFALDPVRRWALWGDVGPDNIDADGNPMNPDKTGAQDNTEEDNLATAPGNYGYPFFAGNNYPLKAGIDAAKPVIPANTDWAGVTPGLMELPPAIPAIHPYKRSCAISGPFYRYDGDLNSSVKFPPHFNRHWFLTDFNVNQKNPIAVATVSDNGKSITAVDTIFKSSVVTLYKPLDFEAGPDGAMYVSNYAGYRTVTDATSIIRIDYTGDCRPTEPKLETPSSVFRSASSWKGPDIEVAQARNLSVTVHTAGEFSLRITDLTGRSMAVRTGHGETKLSLDEISRPGVYFLSVNAPEGHSVRTIVRE